MGATELMNQLKYVATRCQKCVICLNKYTTIINKNIDLHSNQIKVIQELKSNNTINETVSSICCLFVDASFSRKIAFSKNK